MFESFTRRIFRLIGLALGIAAAIYMWTTGQRDGVAIGWTIVVVSWIIYEIWSAATDWPDRTSLWQFIVDCDDV